MNTDEAIQATAADLAEIDLAIEEPAAETDDAANTPEPPPMRILRIKDCASLSGRSTLTYHIGISDDSAIPHLRIFANSAKGYFCKDWISLTLLGQLLSEIKSFASSTVQQMFFEGKSVNSGGFVLAALRNEGLARAIPGSLRSYEQLDPSCVPLFETVFRERFLTPEETQRLRLAIEDSDNSQLKYIVAMLILCGCRKRELLDAQWADFDLERKSWRIPMTKNGKPRHVPLSSSETAKTGENSALVEA